MERVGLSEKELRDLASEATDAYERILAKGTISPACDLDQLIVGVAQRALALQLERVVALARAEADEFKRMREQEKDSVAAWQRCDGMATAMDDFATWLEGGHDDRLARREGE